MKKILSLICLFSLCLISLCACGKKANTLKVKREGYKEILVFETIGEIEDTRFICIEAKYPTATRIKYNKTSYAVKGETREFGTITTKASGVNNKVYDIPTSANFMKDVYLFDSETNTLMIVTKKVYCDVKYMVGIENIKKNMVDYIDYQDYYASQGSQIAIYFVFKSEEIINEKTINYVPEEILKVEYKEN